MAVCALIAAADGTTDASEPARFVGLIGSNDVLSIFPAMDLRNDFDHFCNKLENDSTSASRGNPAIGKPEEEEDRARAVIQIGIIFGGAEATSDDDEKKVVRDACSAGGINPAEFDL